MNASQTPQPDGSDTLSTAGDAAAWLDEHGDALYRYARTRVTNRELAEDLVQEVFLAALQVAGSVRRTRGCPDVAVIDPSP